MKPSYVMFLFQIKMSEKGHICVLYCVDLSTSVIPNLEFYLRSNFISVCSNKTYFFMNNMAFWNAVMQQKEHLKRLCSSWRSCWKGSTVLKEHAFIQARTSRACFWWSQIHSQAKLRIRPKKIRFYRKDTVKESNRCMIIAMKSQSQIYL